jgi:hypothetical protein
VLTTDGKLKLLTVHTHWENGVTTVDYTEDIPEADKMRFDCMYDEYFISDGNLYEIITIMPFGVNLIGGIGESKNLEIASNSVGYHFIADSGVYFMPYADRKLIRIGDNPDFERVLEGQGNPFNDLIIAKNGDAYYLRNDKVEKINNINSPVAFDGNGFILDSNGALNNILSEEAYLPVTGVAELVSDSFFRFYLKDEVLHNTFTNETVLVNVEKAFQSDNPLAMTGAFLTTKDGINYYITPDGELMDVALTAPISSVIPKSLRYTPVWSGCPIEFDVLRTADGTHYLVDYELTPNNQYIVNLKRIANAPR